MLQLANKLLVERQSQQEPVHAYHQLQQYSQKTEELAAVQETEPERARHLRLFRSRSHKYDILPVKIPARSKLVKKYY